MTVSACFASNCDPLAGLTPAAAEAVAARAREVEFRRDERLIPLGQPAQRLLILTEGLAKLVGVSISGHERILRVFRPHDMIGVTVLMDSVDDGLEVAAMTRVRAVSISRRDLLIIARSHPSLIMALAREVSSQLVRMTERVMSATSSDIPMRLSELLLEFAEKDGAEPEAWVPLAHSLTHESMAQIIGASRPHTSTVLRDLEENGAVQRRSGRGLLVRPTRLQDIVGKGALEKPNDQRLLRTA